MNLVKKRILVQRSRGGGFDPRTVAGLRLWLDGTKGLYTDAGVTPATTDGDAVYQWNDQSGNGNHAVQATANQRPTRYGVGTGLYFQFVGNWKSMVAPTGASGDTWSMFLVASEDSAGQRNFIDGDDIADRNVLFVDGVGNWCMYAGSSNSSSVAVTLSSRTLISASFAGGGAPATSWIKVNSAARVVGNASSLNLSGVRVGAAFDGTTVPVVGAIYEVLIYAGVLTNPQYAAVEAYLKAKWGTP